MTGFRVALTALAAAFGLGLPVALAAAPATVHPGQRIDLKVLLLSADGTEPGYAAWRAALDREGVPYDAVVLYTGQAKTQTLTDARLADYANDRARYQAVILASGDLGHVVNNAGGTVSFLSALTDPEWAALAKLERTFGIRRLSDYTAPSPAHGLTTVGGAVQDGALGQLTEAGRSAFPYLTGSVPIADDDPTADEAFGYRATPVNAADWQTLVSAPGGGAYLGIYTHPDDGREEMVATVASNQFQTHNQLLRHGMLNWVTRGVYLGEERNYLELQIDDLFLGDDAWDPVANVTQYDPATASRMTAADVDQAIAWSRARGLRMQMVFNGGGSDLYREENGGAQDPLATKFNDPAVRGAFDYVNHTYDHANIDCSTASFIRNEITRNRQWATTRGLTLDPAELVTGEHSGLANTRPGNPGTIDPPTFDAVEPATTTGALVAPGVYDYALTASSTAGETIASVVPGVTVAAPANSVTATFNAVCHAITYTLYRSPAGLATWTKIGTLARAANAATDNGTNPIELTLTDTLAAGTAGAPPAANGAAIAPYAQNPTFLSGLAGAQVTYVASDASKTYPVDPANIVGAQWPAAATFALGGVRAVPRYPSNVYYNVSTQGQQLDEYNWIYVDPANGGGCVPIVNVTTCRTTAATWAEYVDSETRVMFRHLTGNDPRPHFFHQSNLADYTPGLPATDPAQGGILYPVIDALLARYASAFDRAKAPLVQLTTRQVGDALARQDAWAAGRGSVEAWLQDGRVHVRNGGGASLQIPLTGTTVGEPYGGQRSGWTTLAAGAQLDLSPAEPANTTAPAVSGTTRVGEQLTAAHGTWTGTGPVSYAYQWQRCPTATTCRSIAGATGADYTLVAADEAARLRVVVIAGTWVSSVSQAASALTAVVTRPPAPTATPAPSQTPAPTATPRAGGGGGGNPGGGPGTTPTVRRIKLTLTKVRVSPRTFPVAHRSRPRGSKLDGTRISWRLSKAATVRLRFERRAGKRWVKVGTITRTARKGTGAVLFRGRFGARLLAPRHYRVVISASAGRERTAAKRIPFRVVKG